MDKSMAMFWNRMFVKDWGKRAFCCGVWFWLIIFHPQARRDRVDPPWLPN